MRRRRYRIGEWDPDGRKPRVVTLRRVEQMENDVVAGGDLTDAATMIAEERSHGVPVPGPH